MSEDKKYFIYIIGHRNQLRQPYDACYVYFGNNYETEWNRCSNADNKIGRVIRMHHLNFDENFMVIFFGSLNQCREKYRELRPYQDIGLNDEVDEEHFVKKISNWETPKKQPWEMTRAEYKEWEQKENERERLKEEKKLNSKIKRRVGNPNFSGKTNPKAVIWRLTDPDGHEIIIEGGIRNYCREHNISEFTLKDRLGEVIGPPNYIDENNRFIGGYIIRSEELHQRRLNTIGFKLERLTPKKFRYKNDWKRDAGIREYKNLRP